MLEWDKGPQAILQLLSDIMDKAIAFKLACSLSELPDLILSKEARMRTSIWSVAPQWDESDEDDGEDRLDIGQGQYLSQLAPCRLLAIHTF